MSSVPEGSDPEHDAGASAGDERTNSMDGVKLTELLADRLDIQLPPVGLAFVQEQPDDVPQLVKEAPSFCTLWRWAEERVFYASADQHMGCAIGGMVAGFLSPEGRMDELTALLEDMCEAGQGDNDEISQTARFSHDSVGIVYGPLWTIPIVPDIVLMWATLPQMGVLQEMTGIILWRNNPQGEVFTRPACSILAIADSRAKPAMSLGCLGMRLYTGVPPQLFLIAVPRDKLGELEDGLQSKADISERLEFYRDKLSAGAKPDNAG